VTAPQTAAYPESVRGGRQMVFSPSIWEPQMGYSRGVRVGNQVFIAGTVAADGNGLVQGLDAYSQTEFIIRKIQASLHALEAELEHVVSTVTYLSDFALFADYARAHKKFFGDITPVNTTVQANLVRPEFLVEITAIAVIAD
jgi:enamine deaminase RidA (YjgF/YER057c/UK114 family)